MGQGTPGWERVRNSRDVLGSVGQGGVGQVWVGQGGWVGLNMTGWGWVGMGQVGQCVAGLGHLD